MKFQNEQLLRKLADDYILGGLKGHARVRFERLMENDSRVEGYVWEAEKNLSGLLDDIPSVEPPAHIWSSVENRISESTNKLLPARRNVWWKTQPFLAVAASLLLILAIFIVQHPYSTSSRMQVSLVNHNKQAIARITVANNSHSIELKIPKRINVPPQKSLQLWLLPKQGKPISLAVLHQAKHGHYHIVLPKPMKARFIKGFAISLEPPHGSPQPTGPILYSGYVGAS